MARCLGLMSPAGSTDHCQHHQGQLYMGPQLFYSQPQAPLSAADRSPQALLRTKLSFSNQESCWAGGRHKVGALEAMPWRGGGEVFG